MNATAVEEPRSERRKWSRSDKLSLGAVIAATAACVVSLIQPVSAVTDHFQRPQVTITFPLAGAKLPDNTFGAWGTATHVQTSSDLWLIVRSGIEGRYYPVTNLVLANGHWSIGADFICPAPGQQDVQIYLVPNTDENDLFDYVRGHGTAGMNGVPAEAVLEASSAVDVAWNSAKSC